MRRVIATSALSVVIATAGAVLAVPANAATTPKPDRGTPRARTIAWAAAHKAAGRRHGQRPWRHVVRQAVQRPRSAFTLARGKGDGSSRSVSAVTTLACEPAGGAHPKATDACADLVRSNGAFERPGGDLICPMMFAPVTVTAVGHWRGKAVHFEATYGNECIMRSRTGAVFGF